MNWIVMAARCKGLIRGVRIDEGSGPHFFQLSLGATY